MRARQLSREVARRCARDLGVRLLERRPVGELRDRDDVGPCLVGRRCCVMPSGVQSSAARNVGGNPRGITPMTVYGSPSSCTDAADDRRDRRRTAAARRRSSGRSSRSFRVSSSSVKMRPRTGPSVASRNISALTGAVLTTAGSAPVPRTRSAVVNAAICVSVRLRSRNRTRSIACSGLR